MRILALDTATRNCSAALLINERLLAREELTERGHAERILPLVHELLTEGAVPLADLSAIAFGRGPGTFTGVRLAASVAQGLAFGAGLPVVPVSDLQAIAQRLLGLEPAASRVLVASDARMQEVYWACFERDAAGSARPVGEERLGKPGAVVLPGAWRGRGGMHAAGSGFAAYPELLTTLAAQLDAVHESLLPRAAEMASLAALEVRAGRVLSAEEALPVYLRDEVVHPGAHGH